MPTDQEMLKQAADALDLREKEASDLRIANGQLTAKVATLTTKLANHTSQMEVVAEVLEKAGFDIGEKAAFVRGLQVNPSALATTLKAAFDHFTTAPAMGKGVALEGVPEAETTTSRWRA